MPSPAEFVAAAAKLTGSLAALNAALSPPAPLVIDGVTVPPPMDPTGRITVYADVNPSPIRIDNPLWTPGGADPDVNGQPRLEYQQPSYKMLMDLGCIQGFSPGNAAFNQATMYSAGGVLAAPADVIPDKQDWGRQKLNIDPPTQDACVALGALTKRPGTYGTTARPGMPFVFDIEFAPTWKCSPSDPLDVKKKYLKGWLDAFTWVRQGAGDMQQVGCYGTSFITASVFGNDPDPDPSLLSMMRQLTAQMSFVTSTNYFFDPSVENGSGGEWMGELAQGDTALRKWFPEFENAKIAFVNPLQQIYWKANDSAEAVLQDGKPIPFDIWRRGIDWLVARGYSLWIWMGYTDPSLVRPHCVYAAQHGLTPTGAAAHYLAH